MARTTYVKRAQARFRTVPVLDENGNPKVTPVLKRDGTPKTDKRGKAITMRVTRQDKTQPLPNRTCEKCGTEIQVGDPYKWVKPKSGPYGGSKRVRCDKCPGWQPWDLSNSVSAQAQRIASEAWDALENAETVDDVQAILEEAASQVRDDLAEQRRESAQNIEDGFGHPTYQSEDLESQADELEGWADEIESADVPDLEDFAADRTCQDCDGQGEVTDSCPECGGDGEDEDGLECGECMGSGEIQDSCDSCGGTGEDESEDEYDLDEWRNACQDALSVLDECPV